MTIDRVLRLTVLDRYREAGGGDSPPYAAAIGMPRSRRFVTTDAVSRSRFHPPDDAA